MPPFCALEYAFQFYSSCTPENNSCTNIIFFERHGIMSSAIIPALICFRPKGEKFLQQIMRIPRRESA